MKTRNSLYAIFLCAALSLSGINAQAESKLTVNYLANEQSVVAVSEATRFLLLPVQDDAPEAKVGVISGNTRVGELANVRLARERVDYYVPFSLEAFMGKDVKIDVLGMPQGSLCWKELKLSDTFDMANREKYRPLYHHTCGTCISSTTPTALPGVTSAGDTLQARIWYTGSMRATP